MQYIFILFLKSGFMHFSWCLLCKQSLRPIEVCVAAALEVVT